MPPLENGDMLKSHETRIQRVEEFISEASGQMAAVTEHLKAVTEKLDDVGARVTSSIDEMKAANNEDHAAIKREVEGLKKKYEEQKGQLDLLLADRQKREDRIRTARKAGVGLLLTLLGAIATKWGEVLYDWLFGPRTP